MSENICCPNPSCTRYRFGRSFTSVDRLVQHLTSFPECQRFFSSTDSYNPSSVGNKKRKRADHLEQENDTLPLYANCDSVASESNNLPAPIIHPTRSPLDSPSVASPQPLPEDDSSVCYPSIGDDSTTPPKTQSFDDTPNGLVLFRSWILAWTQHSEASTFTPIEIAPTLDDPPQADLLTEDDVYRHQFPAWLEYMLKE